MKVLKGFEVRLYPTKEQRELIDKTIGCYRFIFNQTLAESNKSYEETQHFTRTKDRTLRLVSLKKEFPWLKEVDSAALQQSVRDFNRAMDNHFKKPNHYGFPKFKTKRFSKQSYRTPYNSGNAEMISETRLKVPKVGKISTKRIVLPNEYSLKSVTITKTKSGKYYAKLCLETEVKELSKTGKVAGFDLGLTDMLISSDGVKVSPPKYARESSSKLAKAQRKLSKMRTKLKESGLNPYECKNYQKQLKRVAKIYEHIANQRKDFNHKLSLDLVREYDILGFEDLNVKGMMRNHHLAYSIQDIGWSQLLDFIQYKCAWYGKQFYQVPRFFASSKTCSECGCYHKDIVNSLAIREWTCPDCGTHHDRDINAAKNIRDYVLGLT